MPTPRYSAIANRVPHNGETLSMSLGSPLTEQLAFPSSETGAVAMGPPNAQPYCSYYYHHPSSPQSREWPPPPWPGGFYVPGPPPLSASAVQEAREKDATTAKRPEHWPVTLHEHQKRDSPQIFEQNGRHFTAIGNDPHVDEKEKGKWSGSVPQWRTTRVDVREVDAWSMPDDWSMNASLAWVGRQSLGEWANGIRFNPKGQRHVARVSRDRTRALQHPVSAEIVAMVNRANQWIPYIAQEVANGVVRARVVHPSPVSRTRRTLGVHLDNILAHETLHPDTGVHSRLIKAVVQVFLVDWCVDIVDAHYPRQKTFADLLVEGTTRYQASLTSIGTTARMFMHFLSVLDLPN